MEEFSGNQPRVNQPTSPLPISAQHIVTTTPSIADQHQTTNSISQKPQRKSKIKKILSIIVVLILLGAVFFGYLLTRGVKDAPEVSEKVTVFMQNVSSGNYQDAYSFTSEDFKAALPFEDFSRSMSLFKAQYSNFESQEQTGFFVRTSAGQPTIYQYSAEVTYKNGDRGELLAILLKENGVYKIISIEVNVGIDRLEMFNQVSPSPALGISTEKK